MTETQRRFLREIAARVGESRVHEVRLYPAIRQGGIESGVAIVAARAAQPPPPTIEEVPDGSDVERVIPVIQESEVNASLGSHNGSPRYEILSARYKLVLKGTERGQWDAEVRHEANAPLDTIDRVVRGVALRSGEDGEPECIADTRFRAALSDAPFVSDDDFGTENGAR